MTETEIVDQVPDDIEMYHRDYLKILNQKYASLDRTVLDGGHKAKEQERVQKEMVKIDQLRRDQFPYNF